MHGSTQKSPVRHKNARFDTKMPSPACTSCHCNYDTPPPPPPPHTLLWEIFFSKFIPIFFQEPIEKWKWNYFDMNSKLVYSISFWKLKCNHSLLFVMAIMSTAINKCYQYDRIFCHFLHFLLIALLKSDTHVRRASLIAGSIMRSTRTFVITVSNDRVSCCPHLEEKLRTLSCRCNRYTCARLPDCRWPLWRHAWNK